MSPSDAPSPNDVLKIILGILIIGGGMLLYIHFYSAPVEKTGWGYLYKATIQSIGTQSQFGTYKHEVDYGNGKTATAVDFFPPRFSIGDTVYIYLASLPSNGNYSEHYLLFDQEIGNNLISRGLVKKPL